MTSRERVLLTLQHKEPDRVPFDLGGAPACGINIVAYRNLVKYLGIDIEEPRTEKMSAQIAMVDELVFQTLGVDVRPIDFRKKLDEEEESLQSAQIRESSDCYWYVDEWGRRWQRPKDKGHYFDIVAFPLAHTDIADYEWPDASEPKRYLGLRENVEHYKQTTDAALVFSATMGNGFLQMGAQLFGFEKWFSMLALEKKRVTAFLDDYLQLKTEFWGKVLSLAGADIDVVCEADDLGTQRAPWISREMYRQLIKPYQSRLFNFMKSVADVKVYFHSDGAISDFIPDLIEAGVDILNPVQFTAANMDSKALKREFGSDIAFWGAGVDTQRTLPYGSKQDVWDEVRRQVEDLARGGGFVFAAVHNIQGDVPPENIVAMVEALHKYGSY